MRRALAGVIFLVGCSDGPGRDPMFRDAGPPRDAGTRDAGFRDAGPPRDAGFRDAGPIRPRDGGPPPAFPFTGVFEIFNSADSLFAREVDGSLLLIVGRQPYIFVGNIDEDGVFQLTAPGLIASGCDQPRINGSYERSSATYTLHYKSCNGMLQVIESDLRGVFTADYDLNLSGTYQTEMTITNANGCFAGNMGGHMGLWGLSFFSDRTIIVYTPDDLVSSPNVYIGRAQPGAVSYQAIHNVDANQNGERYSMSGLFEQVTVNDPLVMSGQRDVYDVVAQCYFSIQYTATRVGVP